MIHYYEDPYALVTQTIGNFKVKTYSLGSLDTGIKWLLVYRHYKLCLIKCDLRQVPSILSVILKPDTYNELDIHSMVTYHGICMVIYHGAYYAVQGCIARTPLQYIRRSSTMISVGK